MATKKFYGWAMVAVLWLQYLLNMGIPLYGGTVISSVMMSDGVITRSTHGMAFTLMNLFIALASILIAVSISRWGIRATFIIGSALIAIGALMMSFIASEPWHFLLALGVLIGTGIGFGSVMPLSTSVSRWFTRMRGRAMAIALTAPSVAGLVFAPTITWLIQNMGLSWQQAWLIVAGTMVISMVTAFLLIKESPAALGQAPDGGAVPENKVSTAKVPGNVLRTSYDWTPRQAYRTFAFWVILIAACAVQFPFFFFTAHWIPAMVNFGYARTTAAFTMSIFTIAGLPARLIAGFLLDRIPAKYVFLCGFGAYTLASIVAIMVNSDTLFLAYLVAALTAFGFGMSFVSLQTVTAQFFGVKAYLKLNSNIMLICGVVACPAAMLASIMFESFGSYSPSFITNMVVGIIGLVAALLLKVPKVPVEAPQPVAAKLSLPE